MSSQSGTLIRFVVDVGLPDRYQTEMSTKSSPRCFGLGALSLISWATRRASSTVVALTKMISRASVKKIAENHARRFGGATDGKHPASVTRHNQILNSLNATL
ncbi:hypothetical protein BST36_30235 [Mycolicibacterium moriokaense]|nr:hypothetical protein BST36_30235 [Mycolicibacterium moriokaense]